MSVNDPAIQEILDFLNDRQLRATYSAVAEIVGGSARSVGNRLGARRPEASWVVSAGDGLPSGYSPEQYHPALWQDEAVITSGAVLEQRLKEWRASRRKANLG